MKAVFQRVLSALVDADGVRAGTIGAGAVVFLGVARGDTAADADWLAAKIAGLRVFADADDKMNRSLLDTDGAALVIPNFTLCGDCRHGRRPEFTGAARPETARPLYEHFVGALRAAGVRDVQTGVFAADMRVLVENDGPITLLLESPVASA